jgi:hypothetical protein
VVREAALFVLGALAGAICATSWVLLGVLIGRYPGADILAIPGVISFIVIVVALGTVFLSALAGDD